MLTYRGGLWDRTARWRKRTDAGERIFRTANGVWIVTAPDLARRVLVEDTATYPVRPSFLRVHGDQALPAPMQAATIRRLLRLLAQAPPDAAAEVAVARLEVPDRREFQSWGIWFMREIYRPLIAAPGRPGVDGVVDEFVRSLLIEATTRGRRFLRVGQRFAALQRRLAAELESGAAPSGRPTEDLLDIVAGLRPSLTAAECAEVYLRLVTALLGATGTALEWTVALIAENPPATSVPGGPLLPRGAVLETQRLWPSSWRLYRECAWDTVLGGRRILAGDHVIVASSVIHRDRRWWPNPDSFLPDRWRDGATPPAGTYLPFSDGPGICPARGPAIEAIRRGAGAILQRHAVEPRFAGGFRPRALALLAPPTGKLHLTARRPERAGGR